VRSARFDDSKVRKECFCFSLCSAHLIRRWRGKSPEADERRVRVCPGGISALADRPVEDRSFENEFVVTLICEIVELEVRVFDAGRDGPTSFERNEATSEASLAQFLHDAFPLIESSETPLSEGRLARSNWLDRECVDPTRDLDLPEPGRSRDWSGTPQYVAALLAAVPGDDRAIWGCAFYAGLRLGKLRALRAGNVSESSIHVAHGWDPYEGEIDPKSKAGVREVPVPGVLRVFLDGHTERIRDELLFGRTPGLPFTQTHIQGRADEAWAAPGLERVTFHAGRHFYKSALDLAGISESRADRYAGHSDGRVANRYRHLLPGQLDEDAKRLDEYLAGATTGKVVPLPTGARNGAEEPQTRMAAQGA
jgi:integrase